MERRRSAVADHADQVDDRVRFNSVTELGWLTVHGRHLALDERQVEHLQVCADREIATVVGLELVTAENGDLDRRRGVTDDLAFEWL